MKASDRLIALASGVHPELDPQVMASVAGEAGYNSAGIWIEPGVNWHRDTTAKVRSELENHKLVALDVEVIWLQPDSKPDPVHHQIIDIGGELGARNCLIVSGEPNPEQNKRLFEDLCIRAEAAGLRACFEFMGVTEVKDLAAALDVVAGVGHPAGGILVDAFHLERVGLEPEVVESIDPRWLSYMQLCDVPARGAIDDPEAYMTDALDGRLAPGEGALPLAELMAQFAPELPISLEIRSQHYRDNFPDPVERAKTILERTREFLQQVDSGSA
ncbi:MAG: TIM barrel protein [Halieaceae bacterium]